MTIRMIRNTHLVRMTARCDGCTWSSSSSNAQAMASRHATRYGHVVQVRVTWHHEYRGRRAEGTSG